MYVENCFSVKGKVSTHIQRPRSGASSHICFAREQMALRTFQVRVHTEGKDLFTISSAGLKNAIRNFTAWRSSDHVFPVL